jgi:hypothetical protein
MRPLAGKKCEIGHTKWETNFTPIPGYFPVLIHCFPWFLGEYPV